MSETSGEMFRSTFSRGDCTMDVSLLSSTHGKEKWSFWLFTGPGVLSSSAYGGTYSATIAGTELLPEPNGTMGDLRLAAPTPLPLCSFEGSTLGPSFCWTNATSTLKRFGFSYNNRLFNSSGGTVSVACVGVGMGEASSMATNEVISMKSLQIKAL